MRTGKSLILWTDGEGNPRPRMVSLGPVISQPFVGRWESENEMIYGPKWEANQHECTVARNP